MFRNPEKRKVGGSTPPLTTIIATLAQATDLHKAANGRQHLRSKVDRWYASVTVIRRSLVHVECTKLDHEPWCIPI